MFCRHVPCTKPKGVQKNPSKNGANSSSPSKATAATHVQCSHRGVAAAASKMTADAQEEDDDDVVDGGNDVALSEPAAVLLADEGMLLKT